MRRETTRWKPGLSALYGRSEDSRFDCCQLLPADESRPVCGRGCSRSYTWVPVSLQGDHRVSYGDHPLVEPGSSCLPHCAGRCVTCALKRLAENDVQRPQLP